MLISERDKKKVSEKKPNIPSKYIQAATNSGLRFILDVMCLQAPRLQNIFRAQLKYRQIKKFLALSLSDVAIIMLINVKMPTIVGILTCMSMINFILS